MSGVGLAARRDWSVRPERVFFSASAVVMILVIVAGFAPSFYLRGLLAPRHPLETLNGLVILHGMLFTAWLLLFAGQAWLMAAGRADVHRRLGRIGFFLLPCLVIVATLTALGGVARPLTAPRGIPTLSWLATPLLSVPVFGAFIALGLLRRNRAAAHKRWMYAAMVTMMAPGFGRMELGLPPALHGPVQVMVLPMLFMVALAAWDFRSAGRVHGVTIWASLVLLATKIVTPLIWKTGWWLGFAGWASGLVR